MPPNYHLLIKEFFFTLFKRKQGARSEVKQLKSIQFNVYHAYADQSGQEHSFPEKNHRNCCPRKWREKNSGLNSRYRQLKNSGDPLEVFKLLSQWFDFHVLPTYCYSADIRWSVSSLNWLKWYVSTDITSIPNLPHPNMVSIMWFGYFGKLWLWQKTADTHTRMIREW